LVIVGRSFARGCRAAASRNQPNSMAARAARTTASDGYPLGAD